MADRQLTYRVTIAGQAEALRDLRGIVDGIRKMKEDEVSLEKSTSARRRKIKSEEQKHNEAVLRVQIAIEKARARESVRNAEKAEKDARAAKQREEREKTKIAEREAKARERVEREAGKRTIREQEAQVRAFERHEREKTRAAQREAREREKIEQSVLRAQAATAREMMRQRTAAARVAERESRDLMFDRKRFHRHLFGSMAGGAVNALGIVGGYATKGMRSVAQGLGLNDTLDIGGAVSEAMLVRKLARDVLVESRVAGGKIVGGQSYDASGKAIFNENDAIARIRQVALSTNTSQGELAKALDVYSAMGSGATGIKEIDKIAKQGKVLGGADVVAKLRAQLDISSDNKLSSEDKDAVIAQMSFLGKMGVFRASEMAKESELLFSRFAASGMDFKTGMRRYIQFANVAKTATGSAAMARTAINAVQNQIVKKDTAIRELGIETKDADGTQRDFIDVVLDVMEKTGAEGQFHKIFDPSRSGQALASMTAAFKAAGKGKAGRAKVEEMLKGALPAGMDDATLIKEMEKDIATTMDSPSERLANASLKIKDALVQELMPAIEELAKKAPDIAKIISAAVKEIGSIARFAIDNPKLSVAMVAGGGAALSLAKDGLIGAARYGGDRLAQWGHSRRMLGGAAGRLAGSALGAVGSVVSHAGSTPVYIVGVAPGVSLGGGTGGFELPGGGGGAGGGAGGMLGRLGGASGMGTALGLAGAGFAAFATLSPLLQEALEKSRNTKTSTEEYNAGMAEVAAARKKREDGIQAILSGEVDPEKLDSARKTLAQFFPDIAKQVDAGQMSPVQAGAEIAKAQTSKGLQFTKGADGTLQSSKLSSEDFNKLAEAIETLTKAASKASTTLNTVSPPAGTSSFNFTPLKTF